MSYLLDTMPSRHRSLLLLAVPLALSSYTHLWNPAGFPDWNIDESTYVTRALGVLDRELLYGRYDHPFLGQTVLAGFMYATGYPDSIVTSADPSSLGMFYGIPRVLMGLLAVLDTFLVYKIAERRFGRRTAVISSLLFAVMPVSLTLRMALLDSILLPFVLASVLLAMHARGPARRGDPPMADAGGGGGPAGRSLVAAHDGTGQPAGTPSLALTGARLMTVLSGICMGCAVLTKIPSLTMIPLVLALIYSANRSPRQALLWLVPVILIAAVWPATAALAGELDLWTEDVLWQADRDSQNKINELQKYLPVDLVQGRDPDILTHPLILLMAMIDLFLTDPVLMTLGTAGLAFAATTRNRFLLLWAAPVLLFFGSIGWVSYFHLGMLWTAMCIAAAALIGAGLARMPAGGGRPARDLALLATVAAIAAFGMSMSGVLVHWDATSANVGALSFALQNHAGSDTHIMVPRMSGLLLSHIYDLLYDSTPDTQLTKTGKTVMVTPPSVIDVFRKDLDRHHGGDGGAAVPASLDWRQRLVDVYDGSDRAAEFHTPPHPFGTSEYHSYVMERSPPEWATLPTYGPGGRALDLDGPSNVALAGTAGLGTTDPFSIAFWIKKSGGGAKDSLLMSNSEMVWRQDAGMRVLLGSAGKIRLDMTDDASNHVWVHSFHSIADGHWHHVVFTYDGSAVPEGLGVYVDGEIDNMRGGKAPMTGSTATDHPLAIIAPDVGTGDVHGILLDDVRIYSWELSAVGVSAMHGCHTERALALAEEKIPPGRAPACGAPGGGLLTHLEFEGDLSDSSGNGNGGTARGDVRYA